MTNEQREMLRKFADDADAAPRFGKATDEPEGERYVIVSDTLARQITAIARELANA